MQTESFVEFPPFPKNKYGKTTKSYRLVQHFLKNDDYKDYYDEVYSVTTERMNELLKFKCISKEFYDEIMFKEYSFSIINLMIKLIHILKEKDDVNHWSYYANMNEKEWDYIFKNSISTEV